MTESQLDVLWELIKSMQQQDGVEVEYRVLLAIWVANAPDKQHPENG